MKELQKNTENTLVTFTDGGARGNPGPAGIGAVLYEQTAPEALVKVFEIKDFIGHQTNNYAEYTALIKALIAAHSLGYKKVQCILDSELVVRQLKGEYKVKEQTLKKLYEEVLALKKSFISVTFTHVLRAKNKEADALVNAAIDAALT